MSPAATRSWMLSPLKSPTATRWEPTGVGPPGHELTCPAGYFTSGSNEIVLSRIRHSSGSADGRTAGKNEVRSETSVAMAVLRGEAGLERYRPKIITSCGGQAKWFLPPA